MTTASIQQEILLVTGTTFSNRQWRESNDSDSQEPLWQIEQLEDACWNGLLNELLPEIVEKTPTGKKLYTWHIRKGESFLQIEMCEVPPVFEKRFSINPYFFVTTISDN